METLTIEKPSSEFYYKPEFDEKVLWEGRPDQEVEWPPLLTFFIYKLEYATYLLIGLVFLFIAKLWLLLVISIVVLFYLTIGNHLERKFKVQHTYYFVSNRRIMFRTWRLFEGNRINILRYDDFDAVQYTLSEKTGANTGTIYLMTGKDIGFWTYDLMSGEKRSNPSLERIPDAGVVAEMIKKQKTLDLQEKYNLTHD
jgi:hypothetical protein